MADTQFENLKLKLPKGVTLSMVEAGMREWDKQHTAGERNWFNMLASVYLAMKELEDAH